MLVADIEAPHRLNVGADGLGDISLASSPSLRSSDAALASCCLAAFSSRNLCLAALMPWLPPRPRGPAEDEDSKDFITSCDCCEGDRFALVRVWAEVEEKAKLELRLDCCC